MPRTNWNEALLELVKTDLDPAFDELHEACNSFSTDAAEVLGAIINAMKRRLREDPAASLSDTMNIFYIFYNSLIHRRAEIDMLSAEATNSLKKHFSNLRVAATTDGGKSYFADAMSKVYADCVKIRATKGKSAHVAKCEAFTESICAPDGVFMRIRDGVSRDCDKMLLHHEDRLTEKVDAVFKKIQHDFDIVCSTQGDDSPEGQEFRQKLQELVPVARGILTDEVRDHLEKCRLFKG